MKKYHPLSTELINHICRLKNISLFLLDFTGA